jgi:putative methionine-R-sulfoxide reductase with GAF domain
LDLDSPSVGRFNEGDARGLERLASIFSGNVRLEAIG